MMGIRPDKHAGDRLWDRRRATGLAGRADRELFYIVPAVGETLGIVAFVTVSLAFGSVPGALVPRDSDRRHRIDAAIYRRGLQAIVRLHPVPWISLFSRRPDGQA